MGARDRKPPNWKHWGLLPEVKSWEAASLSLGIDPASLTPSRDAWMAAPLGHRRVFTRDSFRSEQERAAYNDRFRLIEDAFVRGHGDRVSYHNTGRISLAEFAAWCVENELDVPAEFAALGGASPTVVESAATARPDTDDELAALFDPVGTEQLQTMFPTARRAHMNMGEYLDASDTYMRLALKAQSQCRTTLETLAEIKNPRAVAFVRQANIAHGHQQVNNGGRPRRGAARAGNDNPAERTLGARRWRTAGHRNGGHHRRH